MCSYCGSVDSPRKQGNATFALPAFYREDLATGHRASFARPPLAAYWKKEKPRITGKDMKIKVTPQRHGEHREKGFGHTSYLRPSAVPFLSLLFLDEFEL